MELRELRYLVALDEERSFTRAAARCYVSQQGLSKAIALLERRVGTTLVVRRPDGCTLTPAGDRLARAARGVLRAADAAERALTDPVPPGGGHLRVGLLLDGLGSATPEVLAAYQAALPTVTVAPHRIQPHDLPGALVHGEVDVVLQHGPAVDERLHVVPLFTEQRVAVVSARDPRADAGELSGGDLVGLPARTRRPDIDPGWEGFFTLREERGGAEPERTGEPARSLEELLWAISLDRLFLTVPEHLAGTYSGPAFGVRYVPAPDLPPVVFSVARRRDDRRPEVVTFVELARAVTADRRARGPAEDR